MGKSKVSDIRLHEKSSKEINDCGCPKGCCNDNSCTGKYTEPCAEISKETSEDRYDRKVIGWMLLLPLIARLLISVPWTDDWQIIMDVSFVIMFIIGLCVLFYKRTRT